MYNLLHLFIRVVHSVEDGRFFIQSLSNITVQVLLTNGVFLGRYVRFQSMLVIGDGRVVVDTIAFEYRGPGFVDQRCFLRAVSSILIDVGHRLWVLNPV